MKETLTYAVLTLQKTAGILEQLDLHGKAFDLDNLTFDEEDILSHFGDEIDSYRIQLDELIDEINNFIK